MFHCKRTYLTINKWAVHNEEYDHFKESSRASLVVQGLKLCAPNAGGLSSIPGLELDPHAQTYCSQINKILKKNSIS